MLSALDRQAWMAGPFRYLPLNPRLRDRRKWVEIGQSSTTGRGQKQSAAAGFRAAASG